MKRIKVPFNMLAFSAVATASGALYLTMPPSEYRKYTADQRTVGRTDHFVSADTAKRSRSDQHRSHQQTISQHHDVESTVVDHTLVEQVKESLGQELRHIKEVVHDQSEHVKESAHNVQHLAQEEVKHVKEQVQHLVEETQDIVEDVVEAAVSSNQSDGEVQQESKLSSIADDISTTHLLIGGGSASYSAMRSILDNDPKADVLIVSYEEQLPYMRPPLSKELWSSHKDHDIKDLSFFDWGGTKRSIYFEGAESYGTVNDVSLNKPKILTGRTVVDLNVEDLVATLDDCRKVKFQKVLLATGGTPKKLKQLDGVLQSGKVSSFRNIEDLKKISAVVQEGDKQLVIVGGGFLGSELACALSRYGKDKNVRVTQIMPEEGNMGLVFPKYLVNWTTSRVRNEGVTVLPSTKVSEGTINGEMINMKLSNGQALEADHVIVCIGIEPNIQLAKAAKLEIDEKHGGVLVNSQLEATSNVFAAGDVASFHDVTLGRRRIEHHDHAILSGRLAGRNMVGTKTSKAYKHQSMFWSDLGPEIGYEAVGILDAKLKTVGLWAKASPEDTPEHAVQEDSDNIRSGQPDKLKQADPWTVANVTEDEVIQAASQPEEIEVEMQKEDKIGGEGKFGKGVVFYLNYEKKIVGVLLWNMFNRTNIARRIIADGKKVDDIKDLAQLFQIHDD